MSQSLPNIRRTHTAKIAFSSQPNAADGKRLPGSVGQDKSASLRDRATSTQAAAHEKHMRSRRVSTSSPCSHTSSRNRQTVPLTLWVDPKERAELERLAAQEGLSLSLTGRTLLQEALRQKLHVQHAVLLQDIIQQSVRREMQKQTARLALLLVRVSFNAALTRRLVVNILGRQPSASSMPDETLNKIFDRSAEAAKKDILRSSPSLAPIVDEAKRWLQEEQEP